MDCSPPGSSVHRNSPGKNPGVGCHALVQQVLPTHGSNPGLPHCRWILGTGKARRLVSPRKPPGGASPADALMLALVWCVHVKLLQFCSTLWDPIDYSPPGSSVHRNSPGKNTEVGCHSLLQGIFPTQGSNPCLLGLPHWQAGFYH